MAAVNDTSYFYGLGNFDAAVLPAVTTIDGAARTLQVLVPGARLRPIDPDTGNTIELTEVRGAGSEELTEYPVTDAVGEWQFRLIGYPVCDLGITGPESGAVEKIYRRVVSGDAVAEAIAYLVDPPSGGGFTGSVDWQTQVTNKPAIPTTAAEVGAIPTTQRGAANGVAPLGSTGLVPDANLPAASRPGHTHAGSYDQLPAGVLITVVETSPGNYPPLPTTRTDIPIMWVGSIQATPAQGWRDTHHWLKLPPAS